jgi:hypothetical protein
MTSFAERILLETTWGDLVLDFKDKEKVLGASGARAEELAKSLVRYIRITRIRQYNLFQQRRGEEYEAMVKLYSETFPVETVTRFLEDDELWTTTLQVAEE